MKIKTCKYFALESIKSIIRNRVMSLASITTVAAALFILGIFMLMAVNVNRIINTVEQRIEIKTFLEDEITTLKLQKIESTIEDIPGVKEVSFESKEEALENFKKQLGQNEDLASGLEMQNPIPASYIIKVDNPSDVQYVSSEIAKIEGVDEVKDGRELVDKIVTVTKFIRIASVALMIVLGTIAIFLISNTIKLTVWARKKEISIMKYIGATDWFIRWPFVIEGILLGFLGALVAIGILYYGYGYAANTVTTSIMIFSLVPSNEIISTISWQFGLIGMIIGGLGSLMSLRKFLIV